MPCRIASASPKIGDPFYRKKRMPQKRTCHAPNLRRRQSPKCKKIFSENKDAPKRDMHPRQIRRRQSSKCEKLFSENNDASKRDMYAPFWHRPPQLGFEVGACLLTIYALTKMHPKKFRKLPSAARFCTKVIRHIDFWTFILSIFSKFFRVLNIVKFDIFLKNEVFVIIQLCYHE